MLRTVFVGAVEGSEAALETLLAIGHRPAMVVTLPPNKSNRHSDFADLSDLACRCGARLHHTTDINAPDTVAAVAAIQPDVTLVIGWSQICREQILGIARIGTLGFHPAALPRLRGRAVIPWTILLGEKMSGSTLFWLDSGTDSGPILTQRTFPVAADETARSLYDKHRRALVEMIPEAIARCEAGDTAGTPQDEDLAIYCAKRTPDDGLIDWSRSAEEILLHVRALGEPYPGAFTTYAGHLLHINAARLFAASDRYVGLTGQVQCHTDKGFAIRCGDGRCIEVTDWHCVGKPGVAVHAKLGVVAVPVGDPGRRPALCAAE